MITLEGLHFDKNFEANARRAA